ncbi:Fusaric acid resistance protein-like-domain-containing protein [Aspergillus coremiiformis]|uniref:Fusaric acid resistance protein-like-domain-containing protein n=1 Tax=Aspergillus coremiiformis TaxID=138285 RepID=A0A5N6YW74_9EURO|nr:Fusaric acid resistance protein-like-domain-containing protein [Aspergillus coremiiformis]
MPPSAPSWDSGPPPRPEAPFLFTDRQHNQNERDISHSEIRSHNRNEQEPFLNDFNTERPSPVARRATDWSYLWCRIRQFLTSDDGIGVFKCSLAYFLGSLATLVPAVSALLGPQEGKHIVATITVYFHPARSKGSMYKALVCACLAFLYAAFVSLTSMYVTIIFQRLHMIEMGHALVLILFIGVGFGLLGWTKQKMGDPLVNVACSLASLTSIIVLTKEGAVQRGDVSLDKVSQVLLMLLMGIGATVTVSFLVLPVSASKKLRSNLTLLNESAATMQSIITEAFLQRAEQDLQGRVFMSSSADLKKAHQQLDKLLQETRFEYYVAGTEKELIFEEQLVRWARDITHNLGALHSSALLAFETLRQPKFINYCSEPSEADSITPAPIDRPGEGLPTDASLPQLLDARILEEYSPASIPPVASAVTADKHKVPDQTLVAEIFDYFINQIGPSMRSLGHTLTNISAEALSTLAPDKKPFLDPRVHVALSRAIEEYQKAQVEVFSHLHQDKEKMHIQTPKGDACFDEAAAICAYFSHSLLKFSEQLKGLLSILHNLQAADDLPRKRSWKWMHFWHLHHPSSYNGRYLNPVSSGHSFMEEDIGQPMEMLEPLERQPRVRSIRLVIDCCIQRCRDFFGQDETKFAVKVGAGALLYALPSFVSFTRPFYLYWKGEWGLVSYMLVCSMTIGASNTTGYARFLGTLVGALCSITVWYVAGSNALGLACLGFFMATWTFYISLFKGQGPLGRFIMLTYNLSVLYTFSLSQSDGNNGPNKGKREGLDITKITLHRVGAVLSGCIWGIIITRSIWPISARRKLRTTLKIVWLRLGRIWESDPLTKRLTSPGASTLYMAPNEQLRTEDLLSDLESLRSSARYEFELNAPFPDATYGRIIQHTRSIVNALHALDLQLLSIGPPSPQEASILRHTQRERQTLSTHINHLLQVLTTSITLGRPPDNINIPKVRLARDQLLASLFIHHREEGSSGSILEDGYSLLYAYVLVNDQIINKMADIMADVGRLLTDVGGNITD